MPFVSRVSMSGTPFVTRTTGRTPPKAAYFLHFSKYKFIFVYRSTTSGPAVILGQLKSLGSSGRVCSLGLRVDGLGFWVSDLEVQVWGLEFRDGSSYLRPFRA